jgi:5-hydroxyisourate hydrolase-like protein (transthyretin family)
MATKKNNPKAATRTRKADKKEKVTPAIKAGAKTKIKAPQFMLSGQVRYVNGGPAAAIKIIAFDKDVAGEDRLGEAITTANGTYRISFSEDQFRRSSSERGGPDLFVRVLAEDGESLFQSNTVRNVPRELRLDVRIPSGALVVRGTVCEASGKPAQNARVRAYDQDLRKKQLLGKAVTNAEGRYTISYTSRKFLRAEKGRADLCVVVVNAKGKELVSSMVIFDAPSEASIDLTLPPDGKTLSEYERLLEAILPLLADLKISELEDKDISFLSQESGQPSEHIAFLLAAVRAAKTVSGSQGLASRAHAFGPRGSTIPVESFYGWFRQGLPTDLDELLNQDVDILLRALDASLRANIIPAALRRGHLPAGHISRR